MDGCKLIRVLACCLLTIMLLGSCQKNSAKNYYELEITEDSGGSANEETEDANGNTDLAPQKVTDYDYSYVDHDNFGAGTFMDGYTNAICAAINNGDFSMVQPYLLRGSALYNTQKKRVEKQYSAGKKEYVLDYYIENIDWESKSKGTMTVYEKVDTVESNGKNKIEELTYNYTIEYVNGRYVLTDRLKADQDE